MIKRRKKLNKIDIISLFICFIGLMLVYGSIFIKIEFEAISVEQLLYTINTVQGANFSIVYKGLAFALIRSFITFLVLLFVIFLINKIYKYLRPRIVVNIGIKRKILKIDVFKYTKLKSILSALLFLIFMVFIVCKILKIDEYIYDQINASQLFEKYYVDARDIEIEFPSKKRNLIHIYLESMETTNVSKDNGGLVDESYIPNLEELALENINFSNTDKLGGAIQLNNTNWTIAGLVAQTSGIPLKLSIDANSYKNYSDSLPGVYNLGDILEENGYNNYFMIGSDADFGGRKDFFESHGDYEIYDYFYAIDNDYIDDDYYVWWGYEDKKLFKYAKEKILKASEKDEPFNFTILTVDTHFTDGYMDDSCEEVFDSKYANSIYCSDNKIMKFVNWIKEQDFYENTTIVITGDHLTMQSNFYDNSNYQRTIYNTFINSLIEPVQEKNRLFSSFDIFPTTLAALGVEIEGNRLGLGVNLFSKEKTLLEEVGITKLNEEISRKSFYYNKNLLGNTYYEMNE